MYNNGFIVSVMDSAGNILRESNSNEVYLPFNSEYKIRLRNNHSRNAVANVGIDGTDAFNGQRIIVPSGGSVDLERFCLDGNRDSGRRFKFVPLSDSRVQDPTSSENGKIMVEFFSEAILANVWYNLNFIADGD